MLKGCLPILLFFFFGIEPVFAAQQLSFSGYTWNVKSSSDSVGPGPNYFSDSHDNVWLDDKGWLHLKITERNGQWYCSEVFTNQSLGYGKYIFYVVGKIDELNENVVMGNFVFDKTNPPYYSEIDMEFSKWGNPDNDNAVYVVQPDYVNGNRNSFTMTLGGGYSTHLFDWRPDSVNFQSTHGHYAAPPYPWFSIHSWNYEGNYIPVPGDTRARINLWLFRGAPPSDGQEAEVIVKKFEFIPYN